MSIERSDDGIIHIELGCEGDVQGAVDYICSPSSDYNTGVMIYPTSLLFQEMLVEDLTKALLYKVNMIDEISDDLDKKKMTLKILEQMRTTFNDGDGDDYDSEQNGNFSEYD